MSSRIWNHEGHEGVVIDEFLPEPSSFVVIALGWYNPKAHVDRVCRVREQSDGDEIDAGFSVGAYVFEIDAARGFEGNAAVVPAAAFDCGANIGDGHVVKQDGFSAESQRIFELSK